jgi:lycopene epsilon-cyclase
MEVDLLHLWYSNSLRARWKVQAQKPEEAQMAIADYLGTTAPPAQADVCVVGCGPAGLTLSAALAERGLSVCLVGPESKFTNNYGVWVDEFRALGMAHLLDHTWDESLCYFLDKEARASLFVTAC